MFGRRMIGAHTTPTICKTTAIWAILTGFGQLFCILWGIGKALRSSKSQSSRAGSHVF